MTELTATFEVDSWDEAPIAEVDDTSKLTRASVTKTYSGDVQGTSSTEWLMSYAEDGTATFVGMERITGTFGDREGSVVLQHVGRFADGAATAALTIVAGGSSGALAGATGDGDFRADPSGSVTLRVDFSA